MTKRTKLIRLVVNSVLLVAIVALAVTVYQAGTQRSENEPITPQLASEDSGRETAETKEPMVDAGTDDVEADLKEEKTAKAETKEEEKEEPKQEEAAEETAQTEVSEEVESTDAAASAESVETPVIETNFTEESLMNWPLEGQILLDYSMDHTIYHPTLDQYKCSKGIAIQSSVGSPVTAAANGTVTAIEDAADTGTTVVMDMGNGYECVYGQLKDLNIEIGQTVGQGTILGYVNEPTKYFTKEGSNLYFSMSKDGAPIDPIQYLP